MEKIKILVTGILKSLMGKFLMTTVGIVLVAVSLVVVIIVAVISGSEDMGSGPLVGEGKKLPESVLVWEDDVAAAMEEHELDEKYLYVLLAIMKQESNGDVAYSNGDIFQSSESKCGQIGCITDPIESIDQAVIHFKNNVSFAKDNMEVAIASYNFGNGFATWTQKNHDNKWSLDIAIEFSQHMMTKVNNPSNYTCIRKEAKPHGACYGDILYVPSIMAYMPNNEGGGEVGDIEIMGDFATPVTPLTVTSEFGPRESPGGIGSTNHKGIDFACTGGVTKIHSVQEGQVVSAKYSGGLGNAVVIKHDEGFYTTYGHMSSLDTELDDYVKQGQEIGVCGSTGDSTGPHLHLEVNSEPWGGQVNPRPYFEGL